MRAILPTVALLTVLASPAAAQAPQVPQDPKVFVNVNFGFQGLKQDFTQTAEFPLYDETATWQAPHALKGGAIVDIAGGYAIKRNLSLGIAYTSRTKHTRDVMLNADVPSPVFTDAFRTATAGVPGLEHSEQQIHLQALWQVPVTVEFDVTLFGGPSFFRVQDDLVRSVSITEAGSDFSNVSLGDVTTVRERNTAVGFNVGIDTRYMLVRNAGVGAMLRYSWGSADLSNPTGAPQQLSRDAGGLDIAAGFRFRF